MNTSVKNLPETSRFARDNSGVAQPFMHSKSDEEIWLAFKAGDEAAFIFIYQTYFDPLVNYCYQFTQDHDLIKDCIQDLFIFLRKKRKTISGTNNIKLYLYKCCRNRIMDYIKKSNRNHRVLGDAKYFTPIMSTEDNIINLQTRELKEQKLKNAIAKLSLKEREMIYYFYFENMDYQTITELMGYEHIKSVRSLLYKALNKLKNYFLLIILFLLISV